MKIGRAVLSTVVVCALSVHAFGSVTNSIPYSVSFETNTIGESIIDTNLSYGWLGTEGTVAFVTNFNYAGMWQPPRVTYPLQGETHTNVLYFNNGSISNEFTTNSTYGLTNVYVDLMLQPASMETQPPSDAVTNSQLAVYLTTNGYLSVYHGINTSGFWQVEGRAWTVLTNGVAPIGSSRWVRLTITMDYLTDPNDLHYFMIQMNGYTNIDDNAFTARDGTLIHGGPWFLCANPEQKHMSQVVLSGSGMADDIVVSNGPVSIEYVLPVITATAHGVGGSMTPLGEITIPEFGGSTNFEITATSEYFYVFRVYTNWAGGSSQDVVYARDMSSVVVTCLNVTADGTIDAYFAPYVTTNNQTPYWWLAQYGLTNFVPDSAADQDGDGLTTWGEYRAGTDPTNENSVLKFVGVGRVASTNGTVTSTNTLLWLGSSQALAPYQIEYRTDLLSGSWLSFTSNLTPADGVNVLVFPVPEGSPVFYRLRVITNE